MSAGGLYPLKEHLDPVDRFLMEHFVGAAFQALADKGIGLF